MATTDLRYSAPSDNLAPLATITGDAPLYVDEGLDFLVDLDPATAMRFSGSAPAAWELIFDFSAVASYAPIQWLLLLGTNWWQTATDSRAITVQINTIDSWGSPAFELAMELPPLQPFRVGMALDLSEVVGYTSAHEFIRIVFGDDDAGDAPLVGEVWLSTALRTVTPLGLGWTQDPDYPAVVHETPNNRRLAYSKEVRAITYKGKNFYSDVEAAALETLAADARGRARVFPVQIDPDEAPLLVTLEEFTHARSAPDVHDIGLEFAEVVNDLVP